MLTPAAPARLVESIQTLPLPATLTPTLLRLTLEFSAIFPNSPLPTPYHLILTSFVILLFRYTPDPSLVVCTSGQGSTLPLLLKLDIASENTFFDVLRQVIEQEQVASGDALPVSRIVDKIKPEGPLFRVRFLDSTQVEMDPTTSLSTDLTLFLLASQSETPLTRTSIPALYLRLAQLELDTTSWFIQDHGPTS